MSALAPTGNERFAFSIDASLILRGGGICKIETSPDQFKVTIRETTCSVYELGISVLQALYSLLFVETQKNPQKETARLLVKQLKQTIQIKTLMQVNINRLALLPKNILESHFQEEIALFEHGSFSPKNEKAMLAQQLLLALQIVDQMEAQNQHDTAQSYYSLMKMAETINSEDGLFFWGSRSVLHYAVLTAEMENVRAVVQLIKPSTQKLLEALQSEDEQGFSPFDYLKASGRLPQFYKLLSKSSMLEGIKIIEQTRFPTSMSSNYQTLRQKLASKQDWYGRTGLHWSAMYGDMQTIKDILSHPTGQKCKEIFDIFGHTPFDLAVQAGDAAAAMQLAIKPCMSPKEEWTFGKEAPKIDHNTLLAKFGRFFDVMQRDRALLEPFQSGVCNAAAFLFTLQEDDPFYSGLEALCSWDEKKASLDPGLVKLFESKIEQMLWFQQSIGHQDAEEQSWSWLQRQLVIVDSTRHLNVESEFPLSACNASELARRLEAFRMKHGMNLFIDGDGHAVSLKIRQGRFHYYDINLPYRTRPLKFAAEAANLICTTKYRMLGLEEEPMQLRMIAYRVNSR